MKYFCYVIIWCSIINSLNSQTISSRTWTIGPGIQFNYYKIDSKSYSVVSLNPKCEFFIFNNFGLGIRWDYQIQYLKNSVGVTEIRKRSELTPYVRLFLNRFNLRFGFTPKIENLYIDESSFYGSFGYAILGNRIWSIEPEIEWVKLTASDAIRPLRVSLGLQLMMYLNRKRDE